MTARDHQALLAFLSDRLAMPFAWGWDANDGVSFTLGAVAAMTGDNRIAGLRWGGPVQAARLLKRLGGLEAAMDARFVRIAPAAALRGDIAGVADDDARFGLCLRIVEGLTLVGPGERGIRRLPRGMMAVAWSATEMPR